MFLTRSLPLIAVYLALKWTIIASTIWGLSRFNWFSIWYLTPLPIFGIAIFLGLRRLKNKAPL